MKIKRQKHVRKILNFYKNNFDFSPPYNVLVDGTFCKAALSFKVNIGEQLPKYLDSEVKLQTTRCAIAECEAFGTVLYGPLKILSQFVKTECGHKEPIPTAKCFHRMARKARKGKAKKAIFATQDQKLSNHIRGTAGTPLLYIAHNTITLEAPSEKTKTKAETDIAEKLNPVSQIKKLKRVTLGEEDLPKKKRKKKFKGPNPLSCKKAQKKKTVKTGRVEKKKRSRHRRITIPHHVKEASKS